MSVNAFEKNLRAHNLYVNKPLLKAILTVIAPTLVMTLMLSIYVFASQVIIVRLLPIAYGSSAEANFNHWFKGLNYVDINSWFESHNRNMITFGDVVKGSMNISSPIVTIIGSSPFFLAGGASVLFGQAMGRENRYKANQIFKTSFWMVVALAIIETTLLLSCNKALLTAMSPIAEHVSESGSPGMINEYFQQVHDLQINLAYQYTLILSAGIILPLLIFYLASLIKSEGRFRVVVFASIFCNIFNIGCIVFFILVAKIGIYGGSLGSTVSYSINLLILLIYLGILNKRQQTWLSFGLLFKKSLTNFRVNLVLPIILVGLSAFLIDISYAVANIFYVPILAHTAINIFPPSQGNGMYFQTIEGANMPILNLAFITIYGIVEGERLIIAYNYSRGNWQRIKKTYRYTMIIAFIYAMLMVALIALALGDPILRLFDIQPHMMNDAHKVLIIQLFMLPIFSFQAAAMSIYMSIGDLVKSNISAIFQDTITFFPMLGIIYGICIATSNIWILVATYVLNAFVATLLISLFTEWWIKHRFGKIKMKVDVGNNTNYLWVPLTIPSPSKIQNVLDK